MRKTAIIAIVITLLLGQSCTRVVTQLPPITAQWSRMAGVTCMQHPDYAACYEFKEGKLIMVERMPGQIVKEKF